MATVYIFGDSYSEDFDFFHRPFPTYVTRHDYIHNFLGGNIPKTFGKIIAEKLNYEIGRAHV